MFLVARRKTLNVWLPSLFVTDRIQRQTQAVESAGQDNIAATGFVRDRGERMPGYRWSFAIFFSVLAYPVPDALAASFKPPLPAVASVMENNEGKSQVILVENDAAGLWSENVTGPSGKALPVRVNVSSSLLAKDGSEPFISFSGLPEGCRFSAGTKKTRSWWVPVDKLNGLKLLPSADCEGDFKVLVMVFDGNDVRSDIMREVQFSIHADERMRVEESAPPPAPPVVATVRQPAPRAMEPSRPSPAVASASPPISSKLEEMLLKKGYDFVEKGDISAARLTFETLAARGSSKGAFACAQTFDPAFLKSIAVAGLNADPAKARQWYARAADLGNEDAAKHLFALNSPDDMSPRQQASGQ